MFKIKSLYNALLARAFIFRMSDDANVSVNVKAPETPAEPATVSEQATEIVDTAKELAKDLTKSALNSEEIKYTLDDIFRSLVDLRTENGVAHAILLEKISELESDIAELNREVETVADPEVKVEEVVVVTEPVNTPATSTEKEPEAETPKPKGKKRYML